MIVFHGNASLSFSIGNIVEILAEQGHEVHFFYNRKRGWDSVQPFTPSHVIHMHEFVLQTETYEYSKRNLYGILKVTWQIFWHHRRFDVLIGVDQDAVIAALLLKCSLKTRKLVYLSLELVLKADYEGKGKYFAVKHGFEKLALRHADQLWIQDRFRGKALVDDLRSPDFPFTILPHSPRFLSTKTSRSTFLRDRYHVSKSSKIVIYTGCIHPDYESKNLAEFAATSAGWPDDAVLVMHGFGSDDYLEPLYPLQNHRFILSTEMLTLAELDEMIASADIGIALFNPHIDSNYRLMTSGKIMNYLKEGIPVIATRTITTEDTLERRRAGVCIESIHELPAAYAHILQQYDSYTIAAAQAFATEYEFDKNFQAAWNQLII